MFYLMKYETFLLGFGYVL